MTDLRKVTVSCGTKFHSDHTANQLDKHGLLEGVVTAHPAKYYLNRVPLNKKLVKFLPPVFLLAYGWRKIFGSSSRVVNWLNFHLPVLYDEMAATTVNKKGILLTWAWSGLATIKKVKKGGGIAIVEECGSFSRFQNEILREEYQNLGLEFKTSTPKFIIERQIKEAQLADFLLCPSNHVAESFIKYGIPREKCKVIPYGANVKLFHPGANENKKIFKILFVGTVGVRKGLVYLFKALEMLQNKYSFECIVIGAMESQFKPVFDKYAHLFTYIPHVPHNDLVNYYSAASVFVFPSLDEGMALVQLEALACGLPVLCTPNSGGDAVVEEGKDGFIIPIRNYEKIAERLIWLLENKNLVMEMSANARVKAVNFSWDAYGAHLATFINKISKN